MQLHKNNVHLSKVWTKVAFNCLFSLIYSFPDILLTSYIEICYNINVGKRTELNKGLWNVADEKYQLFKNIYLSFVYLSFMFSFSLYFYIFPLFSFLLSLYLNSLCQHFFHFNKCKELLLISLHRKVYILLFSVNK